MAVLPIRLIGDPVLRTTAATAPVPSERLTRLVEDMMDTMDEVRGVGLAAPQIGVELAVFTYDDREGSRGHCINPALEIHAGESREDPVREGCLSVPEAAGIVERAGAVTLTGVDVNGQPIEVAATGLLATIFQHEMDHLEGTLFVDRLTGDARKAAFSLLRDTSYRETAAQTAQTRAGSLSSSFGVSSGASSSSFAAPRKTSR